MIGDLDPIKAARARPRSSSDELTMHYGLLPRANRGIFAINELPDLAGKIQVGLFNIMQEGDVQIKGYPVRLPLDVLLVLHRQPGGLHGARQDHHAAQGPHRLRDPHALPGEPRSRRWRSRSRKRGPSATPARSSCRCPDFVREVVEEVAFQARQDQKIDKRSGVSQRLPISLLENVVSNAERRALRDRRDGGRAARSPTSTPRMPAITGKFELEYEGELKGADNVARELIRSAVGDRVRRLVPQRRPPPGHRMVRPRRQPAGRRHAVGGRAARRARSRCRGCTKPRAGRARRSGHRTALLASAIDFVLEGLYAQRKISRSEEGQFQAAEQVKRARAGRRSADGARHPADRQQEEVLQLGPTRARRINAGQGDQVKYRYSKFTGDDLDELDLEELLSKLSDCCSASGFDNPYGMPYDDDDEAGHSRQSLHDAIMEAILNGGMLSDETLERMLGKDWRDADDAEAAARRS